MTDAITSMPIPSAELMPFLWDFPQYNASAGIAGAFVAGKAPLRAANALGIGGFPAAAVWQTGRSANYFILEQQLEVSSPPFASTALPKFCKFVFETPATEDTSKAVQTAGRPAFLFYGDYVELEAGFPNVISAASQHASGFGELRGIVSAISDRSVLRLSDDVEAMIERAAQSHGTPENVQAWAHRLAEDVRNLTD